MVRDVKIKRNYFFAIIALILLLGVTGCTGTARNEEGDVEFRRGSRGLEMRFLDSNPPYYVYEHDQLPIAIEMYNRGTAPILDGEFYITGYDPDIITNFNFYGTRSGNLPAPGTPYVYSIEDTKSQFNEEGGYDILEFYSGDISLPEGTTTYDIPLVAYSCYTYETLASDEICVDPQPHRTYVDKPCITTSVGMGGTQGAPVAITYADVTNMRDQMRFVFTISNVGGGTIVDKEAYYGGACPTGFMPSDIDVVYLDYVKVGQNDRAECTPSGRIKLSNGLGKVSCSYTMPAGAETAYKSPLEIKINYAYKDWVRKNIQIRGYD
jgi:hypothetical protein